MAIRHTTDPSQPSTERHFELPGDPADRGLSPRGRPGPPESGASGNDSTRSAIPVGRAVYAARRGGPDVLEVRERHVPTAGPNEVIVEIRAAGVAFGDLLLREGLRPEVRLPAVPGYDAAGVVITIGTEVTDVAVGAHVAVWTGGSGGYATHIAVPAWATVEHPAELRPELVASVVLNYLTAYQLLNRAAPVPDGATILVHPASGGVGSALVQGSPPQAARRRTHRLPHGGLRNPHPRRGPGWHRCDLRRSRRQ
jgi:hypothetical protein